MGVFIDRTGQKYGRLTVVRRTENSKHGKARWECFCECGAEVTVDSSNLTKGNTASCGCLAVERRRKTNTTHGMYGSRTWNCWQHMKRRCFDPKVRQYRYYGGRGITVCERWMKFENFLADMGEVPPGMSLDRIDNNKGYEPDNCRWATKTEQSRNRRNNVKVTVDGREMLAADFVKAYGLVKGSTYRFLRKGWTPNEILRFHNLENKGGSMDTVWICNGRMFRTYQGARLHAHAHLKNTGVVAAVEEGVVMLKSKLEELCH